MVSRSRAVRAERSPYEQVWAAIRAERDRRRLVGGYQAGGHWYHSDNSSRVQQLGLLVLALYTLLTGGDMTTPLPYVTEWRTLDDGVVTLTVGTAIAILAAAVASDSAHFQAALAHKAALGALTDPSEIAAYDFSGGWPDIYPG